MSFVRCSTPTEAITAAETLVKSGGEALFLFFGSENPQTGESWCPDCVVADPVVRKAIIAARKDLTVYECPVGERADWKNQPGHPYRTTPAFRIARIPTLVHLKGGVEVGRLVEADLAVPTTVAAFLGKG